MRRGSLVAFFVLSQVPQGKLQHSGGEHLPHQQQHRTRTEDTNHSATEAVYYLSLQYADLYDDISH